MVTFFFVVLVADLAVGAFAVAFLTVLVVFLAAFFVVFLLLLPPVDLVGIHHLLHATLTRPVLQICHFDSKPPRH